MKNIDNPCIWLIILWFQGCPLPSSALYTCRSLVTTRRRPGPGRTLRTGQEDNKIINDKESKEDIID